ncbi:MAG: ACP S-malonyltransferase [Anaerolineae bacterium]|nr:ACP S-malonyltransferase [Anaerolineae bacterium]
MRTAYLFPGQGSQHVGMGRALYEREPAARAVFDQADRLLSFSLSALCFEGPEAALTDTVNQQPALYVTGIAAWRVIQEQGEPQWPAAAYFAGHSLGEFTALTAAGSLEFADGLALVRCRGELMKGAGETAPGAMAAVLGLDGDAVAVACREAQARTGRPVQLANDNCPGQLVISGDGEALALAMDMVRQAGARKVVPLPITIAAHSPLMATAAAEFAVAVADTPLRPPRALVVGNTTAQPLVDVAAIRAELIAQLTGSVRWTESIRYLRGQGVERFVEVGPGDVLTGLMKRIDRGAAREAFMPAP